jgi:protein-disulfide isomerase
MVANGVWRAILLSLVGSLGATCKGQQPTDTSAAASAPAAPVEVTLPGIDTGSFTPRERREFSAVVTSLKAPCAGIDKSIAACVTEKASCAMCQPAAKFVWRAVRDGVPREQAEKLFHQRFDADQVKNVPIDESPVSGPDAAPVTLIEFADFECPFCGVVYPRLEKLQEEFKGKLRVVYKFYPLPSHPHGEAAARAGAAAQKQGKFWPMHHKLFENQKTLEPSDIERFAKEAGLDLPKFRADLGSQPITDRIARDKKLADDLQIKGTPTIFINGRLHDPSSDLSEAVAMELQGVGATP